jgi:hypothetical protein
MHKYAAEPQKSQYLIVIKFGWCRQLVASYFGIRLCLVPPRCMQLNGTARREEQLQLAPRTSAGGSPARAPRKPKPLREFSRRAVEKMVSNTDHHVCYD